MDESADCEPFDTRVSAARALLSAGPAAEPDTGVILELADALADRYGCRIEAGDPDRARDDLDETVRLLDTVLTRIDPAHPLHQAATWMAAAGHEERWLLAGTAADRDQAIRQLTACLDGMSAAPDAAFPGDAEPPGGGPAPADVHAALARLLGGRYEDSGQTDQALADLDASISHARAGLRCCAMTADGQSTGQRASAEDSQPETVAGLRTLLGLALVYRLGERAPQAPEDHAAVAAARADRDEAIAVLDAAHRCAADELAEPDVMSILGDLYRDRYNDRWPGATADPGDLDAAIKLLSGAAEQAEPDRPTVESLVLSLSDRYDLSESAADRDAFISWGQFLLGMPGADDDGAGLHYLLSLALRERADDSPDSRPADLDAAIGHLEAELAATPPADPDRAGLLASLAQACWDRLDGDTSRYDAVDKMTGYAAQAWPLLPPSEEGRTFTGLYLATGLYERMRRPAEPFDLDAASLAIDVLTQIEPLEADPGLHATVVLLLSMFLVSRAQFLGSADELAAAQPWILRAAQELPADDPEFAELTQTLAAAMSTLALLGMSADHLDKAIELLAMVSARPSAEPDRDAQTRHFLGLTLVQRAGFTASTGDLDDGIAHLRAAWDKVSPGSVDRIGFALNLGSALMTRFNQRSDAQDLDAAEFYLDAARELSRNHHEAFVSDRPDADATIAALRGQLSVLRGRSDGDQAALDDGVQSLRDAHAALPAGHPHQARIRSDLGFALLTRAAADPRPADLQEALAEITAAEAMPSGDMMRPVSLLRTAGALTAAAYSAGDPGLLGKAIRGLTDALGGLDPRFGERVRFVATLGAAHMAMYRLTRAAAEVDAAIGWLEEARRELASRPGHPQRGTCLIELARAYRIRRDADLGRQVGLTALRERGADVLLQTGTARSLGFASVAAAEAVEITGWCLEDGEPQTAVAALELGRSLILHAATAVTGVAEMLADTGRDDLAEEWRAATAAYQDPPWDSGINAADFGTGLLAGSAPLEVPGDLRARALAALNQTGTEKLLDPPSCADIATALTETGADALIYLLDPANTAAGRAIIIRAASGPSPVVEALPLPLLHGSTAGPLTDYSAAYSALAAGAEPADSGQEPAAREAAVRRWRRALEQLCDWAWPTVMSPVLRRAEQWGLGRPSRLVLVPAGRLSLVPWHAARSGHDLPGADRYACSAAVISYAASGRQLIEVSGRPALALQADPVIVGNPALNLTFAELEAQAIRDQCYPAGRYLGHPMAILGRRADGPGRPDELLGQLPAARRPGASVLHLGCHARLVASAPGKSYLELADHQQLTIETILRQASGRPSLAPGGLVSLAACVSDHGGAEYDEALTLATAFLAAGAVTVAGARWDIGDDLTSVLMFMFHHFMTSGGQSPRDSLRLAQLWLLDPGRVAPPQMPEYLANGLGDIGDPEVAAWAAFTHQGR